MYYIMGADPFAGRSGQCAETPRCYYVRLVPNQHPTLDWLARRHAGESAALIAHHAGVTEAAVLTATKPYGPFPRPTQRLGARSLPSEAQVDERVRRWIRLRQHGQTATAIARAEGTSHQLVSRATRDHGLFPSDEVVERWVQARRAKRMVSQIAEEYNVPQATIRGATAKYGPFPMPGAQLPDGVMSISAVAARIGLKYPSVLRWRSTGRLPEPDFVTAKGRELWLNETNERWLEASDLAQCPDCGARCLSLGRHRGAAHQATRGSRRADRLPQPGVSMSIGPTAR
jgi:AraC-like DNA-binding protein